MGLAEKAHEMTECTVEVLQKHLALHPDDTRAFNLGAVNLCRIGRRDEAVEWTEQALRMDPEDATVLYNAACTYALLQQVDEAFGCLEKSVSHGMGGERNWIEKDPDLASLHDHPRFKALLERM